MRPSSRRARGIGLFVLLYYNINAQPDPRTASMTEHDLLAQPAADYMNEAQQRFFRELLLAQRDDLQARIDAEFQSCASRKPTAIWRISAVPKSNANGNCACWSVKRSYWTRSTTPWSCWLVANTAGAVKPANPSACNACCCVPPPPYVSKPKNVKSCANAIDGQFDRPTLMRNT